MVQVATFQKISSIPLSNLVHILRPIYLKGRITEGATGSE